MEKFQSLYSGQLQVDRQPSVENQNVVIYTVDVSDDNSCSLTVTREVTRNDKGAIPLITPDDFTPSAAVVMEAGVEIFLWCGQNVDNKTKTTIQQFVKVLSSVL